MNDKLAEQLADEFGLNDPNEHRPTILSVSRVRFISRTLTILDAGLPTPKGVAKALVETRGREDRLGDWSLNIDAGTEDALVDDLTAALKKALVQE
jgi:hypothetical protein